MHRVHWPGALVGCVVIAFTPALILGQTSPAPACGRADEFAAAGRLSYYLPQPGFYRQNRDIDVQVADLALSAHMPQGWEFLVDGFALRAHGNRTAASLTANPPQVASNALALGGGPEVRWNFLQLTHTRVFLDAGPALLLADRPFPQHGSSYDFLLRAGAGISVRVSESYWLEAAFHVGHISNGKGLGPDNPTWQGTGVSLGIRRAFRRPACSARSSPSRQERDESAWTTAVEYYTRDLGALRISRSWHVANRLEVQASAIAQTQGSTGGFGSLLRWNFLERGRLRLFTDAGADFVMTGSPAYLVPWSGDGYHFILLGGGGAGFQFQQSYSLEWSLRGAHVTTGFGSGAANYPVWSGVGLALGLRRTF